VVHQRHGDAGAVGDHRAARSAGKKPIIAAVVVPPSIITTCPGWIRAAARAMACLRRFARFCLFQLARWRRKPAAPAVDPLQFFRRQLAQIASETLNRWLSSRTSPVFPRRGSAGSAVFLTGEHRFSFIE
jgi:hypothetical protein